MSKHPILLLLPLFFLLSGFAGLGYEILWTRLISNVIGSTHYSISIITTLFMGSLGVGGFWYGKRTDKLTSASSLVLRYGLIEIFIGLYALALPLLLTVIKPLLTLNYQYLYAHTFIYQILVLLCCGVILAPPVLGMGATLPIICKLYVTKQKSLGMTIGFLYGINTLGAAIGVLYTWFWGIPSFGVSQSTHFVVFINLLIGTVSIFYALRYKEKSSPKEPTEKNGPEKSSILENVKTSSSRLIYPDSVYITAFILLFVSSFSIMAYELIWVNLLGLIIGPTSYSFAIVLFVFILGLALGSVLFGYLVDKFMNPLSWLFFTQVGAVILVMLFSQILGNSQFLFSKILIDLEFDFAWIHFTKVLFVGCMLLPPVILMGGGFSIFNKFSIQKISGLGRGVGKVYGVITLGNVLGSFITGFILLPYLGKETSLKMVAIIQIIAIFALLLKIQVLKKNKNLVVQWALFLVAMTLTIVYPRWNHHLLSKANSFGFPGALKNMTWSESYFKPKSLSRNTQTDQMLSYQEGLSGTVAVWESEDVFGEKERSLYLSGKSDASTKGDMFTQTMLAHYPMLSHPNPKKVMVMGLASGVTAAEVALYPVDQVDVIEIDPNVVEASKLFKNWNNDLLNNPKINLIVQDAKSHMLLTSENYDVIISEPSNPWMAGLADLFTEEFFTRVKEHLSPGGVFVQFIHSYKMDWESFSLVGRTFERVFPHSQLVRTMPNEIKSGFSDYLLVGFRREDGNEPGLTNLSRLYPGQENLNALSKSKNVRLNNPDILHQFVEADNLAELFGKGPLHTENNPILEYQAAKVQFIQANTISQKISHQGKINDPFVLEKLGILKSSPKNQLELLEYSFSVYQPYEFPMGLSLDSSQGMKKAQLFEEYCTNHFIKSYRFITDERTFKNCSVLQLARLNRRLNFTQKKGNVFREMGRICEMNNSTHKAIHFYEQSLRDNEVEFRGQIHQKLSRLYSKQGNLSKAKLEAEKATRYSEIF